MGEETVTAYYGYGLLKGTLHSHILVTTTQNGAVFFLRHNESGAGLVLTV